MKRKLTILGAAVGVALAATAAALAGSNGPAGARRAAADQLVGAGSTFVSPLVSQWQADYESKTGVKIVTGSDGSAWAGSHTTALAKIDEVKRSGAVSPAARATASVVPVRMPLSVVGRTTPSTVRQRLTPRARLASRSETGTRASTSCAARETSGNMMIASAIDPAQPVWPWPATSSAKRKMPITIDGMPFSTSSARRLA